MKPPDNFLLSQFLGYFVLTNAESVFPLCSYFIFVAFGYWLGEYYQKILKKDIFYNSILIYCIPIVIIYNYFRSNFNISILTEYHSDEYYSLCVGPDAIVICVNCLIALAIFYKIHICLKGKTPKIITYI